ncbi:7-carboxy-7-deazaguanine synthase QueE [Nocardiopsis sp. MG754419]|uniref:7-carboxy-7-deazaguanine synthase QueE n=1 Tax=Nocardiopsis sp. MG754419 TaxID=2259865 RepID=UPI001BA5A180|nr:7-carboxy-7-deazaguanine synthase QueE [Nocardiopsis sp. MG754419]MBR8740600.1 7-carboxy-7-deazaguanine synthase QueE [Nocardiopsis sp. MG754419]
MSAVEGDEPRLLIAERFGVERPTFQGEGPSCGVPALFIRLSRCNLDCTWCDTPYTWDTSRFDLRAESSRRSVRDLVAWARSSRVELVVITGGEPLIQQRSLVPLVRALTAGGQRVEFETNGTLTPDPELLVDGVRFNVSPKLANSGVAEHRRIVPETLRAFAASGRAVFKFVARTEADLDEIDVLTARHGLAPIWVMPEGATPEELIATTRVLADSVAARRWHLAQRLHVMAFAQPRGR